MSKMKKRPSLLLEILMACTLLTLCVSPLIRKPVELYLTQMKALQDVEKERLADLSFAELKWELLQNEIPWKDLPAKKSQAKIFPLPDAVLQIPYSANKPIKRRAIFKCRKEKLSSKGEIVRLLELEIQFEPFEEKKKNRAYVYQVVLKKQGI